jgi:hypothetical protein
MQATTWREFLANLKSGQTIAGTPGGTNWTRHVEEISTAGQIVCLTEDDWNYWLEVLPPRWMSGCHFCFAEGDEAFRLFWATRDGQFFGRQLTIEETLLFCRFAGTRPPAIETRFLCDEERQLIETHLHPPIEGCCGDGNS